MKGERPMKKKWIIVGISTAAAGILGTIAVRAISARKHAKAFR